ncbi:DUF4157 domain-containing protein [Streptomyces sp. NPDC052676]|uniref:eCIS core domain-containing protein n=1 Tax=Streptomyces sp. NPDC052676 TaxID=3154953 RepID=UPI00342F85FA
MSSRTQQDRAEQSAEERRRKRKERAAKSRTPEPKNIVSGAGQPLDPGVRRELEEQLGHDLSRVRLHTGRDAGQLTDLLGADAVAVGQDVFFREGMFKPGTDEGRRLLAHELLHTVQNPHGLGALRAGRELGAVSLPQQAIEREAEGAARELVRDPGQDAPRVEEGQATPGWLRYATVNADRRRMEQLDPATLVDRLANTLLRSLRGDPEDRSRRVRLQLARMAPDVQDVVLDRLELRVPSPVLDRLLEAVEETEQAGPLPMDAAAAPHAVPGAAEEVEEDRAREESEGGASGSRERKPDARRDEDGTPGGKPQGGRTKPPGRQEQDTGDRDESASGDQEGARRGDSPAARQQQGAKDEQERSQEQQEDRAASDRDARKDAADERKEAADTEQAQQDQDKQDERGAGEDAGGQEETPQEPEKQAAEQERQSGAVPQQPAAPAAVDRSGAEPGEKPRIGGDIVAPRTMGDPENAQDADDEPLGLEAESVEDGAEADVEEEASDGRAPEIDTAPSGEDTAVDPRLFERRKRGAPRAPALTFSDGPSDTDEAQDTPESAAAPDLAVRTDEDDAEDRAVQELMEGMTTDRDSAADEDSPTGAGLPPGAGTVGTATSVTGKDVDKARSDERQEDAEAARRDEEARAADGAGQDPAPPPGEAAGPDQLAKAGEDARAQTSGSPSGGSAPTGGASGGETAGRPHAGQPDRAGGAQPGAGSGKAAQEPEDKGTKGPTDRGGDTAEAGKGGSTAPSPGEPDVTEGKGPATSPGPATGTDKVSTPGPAGAPKLAPGNGPAPMAVPEPRTNAPKAAPSAEPSGPAGTSSRPAGGKRQAARQAAKTTRRGGGSGRTAPAPAPVRAGGRGGGRPAASGGARPKKEAPAPDVSNATPESGLATAASLKPHQALETLKGVDGAVARSVDKERTALRKAPPTMQRPSGSPRTVPGGPKAAAPGTYTNAKVARTEATPGKTPEITGEQKPEGEVPGADVPEPSWWDIGLTIGAQLIGKLLKEILPLDDLIDSILQLPTKDEGLRGARVGDAPRLPLENDSDPQRTDEQSRKLDERRTELHTAGREDAARPMGEDQIYPDVPKETLTGKVAGGKKTANAGGPRSVSGGGVPIESASAVAEHDRGPQIQAGFAEGRQKMTQERQAKDKKAAQDRQKHDQDLQREVTASSRKQADARDKGRSDIADSRDKWRKEQDDKVAEIDGKKGKKYDQVREDIDDKQEQTDKDVDKRTEDDNKKIEDEQTKAERDAEKKQEEGKSDADNWLEEALEKLKEFFESLKNAIKGIFERARQVVTDLIDKFKQQVFKLIDDARNWVIDQINKFADALIALGDELLADYPAMRDKWRNTINDARDWAVQKVNEAADALKEVAGKLLDGLCGALLAGLDVLEGGLLAAVDIAETVTVGALEFGAAAVAALGEWAAIFNDIVSDPGDWISKAGAAAETGAKEYLFQEIKTAVKAWFNQKVQEIIGIPAEDFQELVSGGVTVEQMAQMAWDEAVPQLPFIIGVLVVEKVVAKLIPGAGWVMAIIDALQTAWGALSEILAAFGLFMDFLKSVKSGNGALPFAKAVAAGVVALLELVYTFLIEGVGRFMGKVADRLGDMLKKLRTKKDQPGRPDSPDQPSAPNRPKDDRTRDEGPMDADRRAAPPLPRKPSPDSTSRPPSRPRPGKRSSPEKNPRPSHTTRPKKRRPDDERREEGREVTAARRRTRDAERRTRDESREERTTPRRGPARDTLRKDRDRHGGQDRDPARTRLDDDRRINDRRETDDRLPESTRRRGGDSDRSRDRDGVRDRSRRLRRARQTVKSAANRARRAALRLYGKARRRITGRLNDRLRRLRDLWRRRRDRLRDDRSRRPDRDRRPDRRSGGWEPVDLPKVRYADADDGERHTLMYHGRGPRAPLYIHSTPKEVPPFLDDWRADLDRPEAEQDRSKQLGYLKRAQKLYKESLGIQAEIPTGTNSEEKKKAAKDKKKRLKNKLKAFADNARHRLYYDLPEPIYQPFMNLDLEDDERRSDENHESRYLGTPAKTVFGGKGEEAPEADDGQPPGWEQIQDAELSHGSAWVRMHLLPERLGGRAKGAGNNLVPARGPSTNTEFRDGIELPAYRSIPEPHPLIWYRSGAKFNHPDWPHLPSHIYAQYGGYEKIGGTGKEWGDWRRKEGGPVFDRDPEALAHNEKSRLSINLIGRPTVKRRLLDGKNETLARHFVDARKEIPKPKFTREGGVGQVRRVMKDFAEKKGIKLGTDLQVLLDNYEKLIAEGEVNWSLE